VSPAIMDSLASELSVKLWCEKNHNPKLSTQILKEQFPHP
jgi:hypothetical protein